VRVGGDGKNEPQGDPARADVEDARERAAASAAARDRVAAQARLGLATASLKRAVLRLRRVITTPRPR
jgi:hypothetical protein